CARRCDECAIRRLVVRPVSGHATVRNVSDSHHREERPNDAARRRRQRDRQDVGRRESQRSDWRVRRREQSHCRQTVIPSVTQSVQAYVANVSFAEALALFPAAVALHVYEEWPRFPQWARRFASATYSDRDYIATHVMAIAAAIAFVMLVRAFPSRAMLFVFFAMVF